MISVGNMPGLLLAATIVDHSHHQAFLSYRHNQVHLVIHHPGNEDAHERMTKGRSWNASSLQMKNHFSAHTSENADHEFHLPGQEQQVIRAAKKEAPSRSFLAIAAPQVLSTPVKPVFISSSPHSRFKPDPMLLSLRTIVLLV